MDSFMNVISEADWVAAYYEKLQQANDKTSTGYEHYYYAELAAEARIAAEAAREAQANLEAKPITDLEATFGPEVDLRATALAASGPSNLVSNWIKNHNRRDSSPIRKQKARKTVAQAHRAREARNRAVVNMTTKMQAKSMMLARPLTIAQHQRQNIGLMSRILSSRGNASPFTLILDDLNQSSSIVLEEFIRRALSRNIHVIVIGFETTHSHADVRHITGWRVTGDMILAQLELAMKDYEQNLVIVDNIADLVDVRRIDMAKLFDMVSLQYNSSLVGVYHLDEIRTSSIAYQPPPLEVFKFMATTVITCKSLAHEIATKAAKERSLPEPNHGLLQGAEGIVQCLDANYRQGIVLHTELRRKSGRVMTESFFLRLARTDDYYASMGLSIGPLKEEFIVCLAQVPVYRVNQLLHEIHEAESAELVQSTFNLNLTDKQKLAREEVVLPYFDAQNIEGNAGEGGRILYDMGAEDDFDEEEDEI